MYNFASSITEKPITAALLEVQILSFHFLADVYNGFIVTFFREKGC
jgi:hypothetical protein